MIFMGHKILSKLIDLADIYLEDKLNDKEQLHMDSLKYIYEFLAHPF